MSVQFAFRWDGEAMYPIRAHARRADAEFVIGETYTMTPVEERSAQSHRHFFACIRQAWANLPEAALEQFPTSEHLRKFALIKTGFADSRTIVGASRKAALDMAAFVKPLDTFAVVTTDGPSVTVWTAKSQSARAMGKAEFQRSKTAVLEYLAGTLGVARHDLESAEAA